MGDFALELCNLSKRFVSGKSPALDKVSAKLPENMIIGVVGPDGAGKTTLLRILAGLLTPSEGSATIFGEPAMAGHGGSQPYIGYMPQKFGLYEDLTVLDNLKLHARLRDLGGTKRDKIFERLLNFTALQPFTGRLAGRLSGGMKQKLGLACALLGSPRLLLLDEPGVGVDPQSRQELWSMVSELTANGMTVVWSTAYMDEAERCAWVLMLENGHLIRSAPPSDFLAQVKGRTFFALPHKTIKENPTYAITHNWARQSWQDWTQIPGAKDVLVQGSKLRILFEVGGGSHLETSLQVATPRLEDAYMDSVGGIHKTASPYSLFPPVWTEIQNRTSQDSTSRPVIEAVQLTKKFADFTAVKDITFSVQAGKIFGLLGPNGAGKSTTFRMLCGLSRPTSGKCYVAGVNLLKAPGKARSRMGYMAQKFSLYGDMTVSQNIKFFAEIYGLSKKDYLERSEILLETLGLKEFSKTITQVLPLGQKQRLALLCATLHDPAALFLDEPTSGVDPRTRREFWKHINALTSIGVSVLVTTHFMEEAEYCDELALIYQGQIIAAGTPDSLKHNWGQGEDPTLEDAFITRIETYNKENPNAE